jgi:hypothetical protein
VVPKAHEKHTILRTQHILQKDFEITLMLLGEVLRLPLTSMIKPRVK